MYILVCLGDGRVTDVLQMEYGGMKAPGRHPVSDDVHSWCEAKEKEVVCITIPVLYLHTRGGEYDREKRRLPTALNCLCSSL